MELLAHTFQGCLLLLSVGLWGRGLPFLLIIFFLLWRKQTQGKL
jgi:hypothetical protein